MYPLMLCLVSVIVGSESAKILGVFSMPAISHQVVFRPVMHELAKRGHEVTVITTDPAFAKGQAPENLTEIDVHDVSYEHWNQWLLHDGHWGEPIRYIELLCDVISNLVKKQLKVPAVQKLLQDKKKFDLIFVESFIRPILIFSHIFDAPVIEFSSLSGIFLATERVGAAKHPFIYPDALRRRIYNLTLWEKLTEFHIYYTTENIIRQHVHKEDEMLRGIFGPNIPNLDDLKQNVRMLFLNVHPIWDLNRPISTKCGLFRRLAPGTAKRTTTGIMDWKSYLESSKNGVIYVSFGTNVKPSTFSPEKLKIFTNVLSQLPYDVLWKWDNDELPGRPKNVRISKWLPQSDLLRHPKVKLFITQGGLQSTDEALSAGIPLIGVPMLGDQWYNAEQYVKFNIGKRILLETLTEEQLMDAIKTVINDESYRQNVVRLRDLMHDQPQSPLERAVWWTEHVLRHGGGAHLRAAGADVDWTEYYELKTLSVLLAIFVLFLVVFILIISKLTAHVIAFTRNGLVNKREKHKMK